MRSILISTAIFALTDVASAQPAVEVTSCGQVVPDKTVGYLSADLDCSGFGGGPANASDAGAAVNLGRRSALDLRGFTLTAGLHGVLCNNLLDAKRRISRARCEVFGGTITGIGGKCIGGDKPIVHDMTVIGCDAGVYGYSRLALSDSTISGSTNSGAMSGRARIFRSSITASGILGVTGWIPPDKRLKIVDSTVTGNGGSASFCDDYPNSCGDISAFRRPRLRDTTCDRSVGPAGSWGVCSAD